MDGLAVMGSANVWVCLVQGILAWIYWSALPRPRDVTSNRPPHCVKPTNQTSSHVSTECVCLVQGILECIYSSWTRQRHVVSNHHMFGSRHTSVDLIGRHCPDYAMAHETITITPITPVLPYWSLFVVGSIALIKLNPRHSTPLVNPATVQLIR